jgi:hypothetical protein
MAIVDLLCGIVVLSAVQLSMQGDAALLYS